MNIRKLTEEDWETLCSWWKWWPKWEAPVKDFLPENGTGGLIVEINNIPVVAGFIYFTNSKTALLEWIVSNPNYRETNRKDAIEALITASEEYIKQKDYKYVFAVMQHKKLIQTHEKLGWIADAKHSYELTKVL